MRPRGAFLMPLRPGQLGYRKRSLAEQVMETFHCASCGAKPGERCHTPQGRPATNSHKARFTEATTAGKLPIP